MIWRARERLYGVSRKKKYIPLIFGIGYVFHVFMGEVIQRQELSNAQQQLLSLTSPLTEEMEGEESESLTNGNKEKAIQAEEEGLEETSTAKSYLTTLPKHVTGSQFEDGDFANSDGNDSFFHVDQSDKYPSVEDDRIVYQVYIMILSHIIRNIIHYDF